MFKDTFRHLFCHIVQHYQLSDILIQIGLCSHYARKLKATFLSTL